ncbi:GNAT family N-acetyltransferase [Nonomuraea sp. CA-143628]|uniref:GNAT family N-acetyltransferase n=1 Tax=Nonomuraea sp. CA-143628 TaxID=3239997 RepID=UPI003D91D7C1
MTGGFGGTEAGSQDDFTRSVELTPDSARSAAFAHDFARSVAFTHDFTRRKAGRTVEVPGGFAVLNDRYPGSYDDNKLVIWSGDDPGAALKAADQVLAGYAHRLVNVDDDRLGRAYAPAFEAAGYTHETNLVMVFRGAFPHDAAPVEHLDLPALLPTLRAGWRETLPEATDDVIDQLARRMEERLRGADTVGFRGVRTEDGELAARADIYRNGAVTQIEDLYTGDRHRGRGHARTLMRALLAEAAGSELVFLLADADDWPKDFYERLGFEPVGHTHSFLRA